MGFLDKAKKLAGQALDLANEAVADATSSSPPTAAPAASPVGPAASGGGPSAFGTPYMPGMFGRPGWRERDLVDPAGVLPMWDRHRAGIPHSTKSEIIEEPYGMGRRWTANGRSAGLFYRLYPEHRSWSPPGGVSPSPVVPGAESASLPDGRSLLFIGGGDDAVVLETLAIDEASRAALAGAVAAQLRSS